MVPVERRLAPWSWPCLVGLLIAQLWVAHALVFFAHEYAHTFAAWALGWKSNPLRLDYGQPSVSAVLIQLGINQNIDEVPIFASGHGVDAAIIAGAGAVIGNALITLPLSRLGYGWAKARTRRGAAFFAYWCTVASIGNLIDYVPIRTFTLTGDIGSVQRGLGWSPWTVILVLGVPTLATLAWFFVRVMPATMRWLFPASLGRQCGVAVLTVAIIFGFYGAAGFLEGGPISYSLSSISVFIVMPLMIAAQFRFLRRRQYREVREQAG